MKVNISKCEWCKKLFEDDVKYNTHYKQHKQIDKLNIKYPPIDEDGCEFANGYYSVKRTKKFYNGYKKEVIKMVGEIGYHPMSYGWFRYLDDSDNMFYGVACRILCFCSTCYKEWGQSYYSNKCCSEEVKK